MYCPKCNEFYSVGDRENNCRKCGELLPGRRIGQTVDRQVVLTVAFLHFVITYPTYIYIGLFSGQSIDTLYSLMQPGYSLKASSLFLITFPLATPSLFLGEFLLLPMMLLNSYFWGRAVAWVCRRRN